MSELIENKGQNNLQWQLLTTVSAAALLIAVSTPATAQDTDRPTVWIELGGQLERLQGREDIYAAPFVLQNLDAPLNSVSPTVAQRPPRHEFGGEGKLSFQPANSDWVFTAAVRYGRSNGKKTLHQQTHTQFTAKTAKYGQPYKYGTPGVHHGHASQTVTRFNHSDTGYSETHAVIDFRAGKDVGLGLFGNDSESTLSAGLRIAQFTRRSDVIFRSLPDPYYPTKIIGQFTISALGGRSHHSYYAHQWSNRSFRGIGPSISWDGSAAMLGHRDRGEVTFDWGANAALLFGRQKVVGAHQTTGKFFYSGNKTTHYLRTPPTDRSHSVVVPNIGGFAGVSVKYPNVKFSLGYRADFFFNAMDQGIDTRRSKTQGLFGPFASFAVGL
jgi:hypothetical protein